MVSTISPRVTASLHAIGAQHHTELLPQEYNREELVDLLCTDQQTSFPWLRSFVEQEFSEKTVAFLFDRLKKLVAEESQNIEPWATLNRIIQRTEQLQKIDAVGFESQKNAQLAYLRCALFIETRLDKTKKVFVAASTSNLLWNLQTDAKNNVYLIARAEYSVFSARGSFKTVVLAAKCTTKNLQRIPSLFVHTMMEQMEAHSTLLLQGQGVVRLITAIETGQQASCILRRYEMDAFYYIKTHTRQFSDTLLLAKGMLSGLHTIHAKHYAQLDVKLENMLLQVTQGGTICKTAIADFGFASSKIETLQNFAGTYENFAPEMVGLAPFSHDMRAADMWAAGCQIYRSEFRQNMPWIQTITDLSKLQRDADTPEKQQKIMQLTSEFRTLFERVREQLITTPGPLQEMSLRQLAARMLTLNPKERPTAKTALQELVELEHNSIWARIKRAYRVVREIARINTD